MENDKTPTLADGKICYVEIPTNDVETSANFYREVFGWQSRTRGDGNIAFDDTVGQVSGAWITGRKVVSEVGVLIYIMVKDINATADAVTANGGQIVQPVDMNAPEIIARFTDPAGNILGIYQERALTN